MPNKLYQYDCETTLNYLGTYVDDEEYNCSGYDLYICTNTTPYTLIARYGEEGHQYVSTLDTETIDSAPLIEAKKRAVEQNFIITPTKGVGEYPTVDIWNRWIQKETKGAILKEHFYEDLDMLKWEDRFILFCRVSSHLILEIDDRPRFSSHMKTVRERITKENITTYEEYLGMWSVPLEVEAPKDNPDYYKDKFKDLINDGWEWTHEDGSTSTSGDFMIISHLSYDKIYPKETHIRKTAVGKCATKYYEDADKSLVQEYFRNLLTEFCATVEMIYQSSVSLKKNGENLFLLKSQIDWKSLFDMRDRIDIMFWYFREWECCNLIGEVHNPYRANEKLHWNYTEFIVDWVFYLLTKAYSVDSEEYRTKSHLLDRGSHWWFNESSERTPDLDCFLDEDMSSLEVEDYVDFLTSNAEQLLFTTEIYKTYVEKYGSLQ